LEPIEDNFEPIIMIPTNKLEIAEITRRNAKSMMPERTKGRHLQGYKSKTQHQNQQKTKSQAHEPFR